MRAKALLQNLVLLAASLLVTAALIEVAARVWAAREAAPPTDQSQGIAQYHPVLGWDKPSGGHMRIARHGEFDVEIALNAHGLRGPDRNYAKPAGARRVLILGDSFGEGYYVEEPESARAVLERLLNADGCGRVEVINGATAGYSTDQEYLFFEAEGKKYAPDLVLLFFYYNDLLGNTTGMGTGGKPKPYFDVDGERLELRNSPVPRLDPERAGLRPFRGSLALRLLSNRVAKGSPWLQRVLASLGLVERSAAVTNREFDVFGPRRPEVDDRWRRTRAILAELRRSIEASGGRLAILYVPVRLEVNDSEWDEQRRMYALGPRWERDRVRVRLTDVGNSLGIPVSDPTPELRRVQQPGRSAYYEDDGHWNAIGNAVVAHVLEPQARRMLGCSDTTKR